MQKGISLVDLAKRIEENQNLKADYIAPTSAIAMTLDTESKPQLEISDRGTFPILRTAHDQIATHADIPTRYYQRMLQEAPSLLADNVNRWFADNSKPRMLRTLAGDARALLIALELAVETTEPEGERLSVSGKPSGATDHRSPVTGHRSPITDHRN